MSCDYKISETYQEYLDQIPNPSTATIMKTYAPYGDYDYSDITKDEMVEILLKTNPSTYRGAKSAVQALKKYLMYINATHALDVLSQIGASEFAKYVVSVSPNPYLTQEDLQDVLDFIDMSDSPNTLYIRSFVRACFEGIYSEDLSALINLKARDIKGNTVTLIDSNGSPYEFEISHDLAFDLIELAKEDKWYRKNRLGTFSAIKMSGYAPDTCFKSKSYTDLDNIQKMKLSYWRITRNLGNEYGRKFSPKTLFISGMICRIEQQVADFGLTMMDVLSDWNTDSIGFELIRQEFDRCHYYVDPLSFKETVRYALDFHSDE